MEHHPGFGRDKGRRSLVSLSLGVARMLTRDGNIEESWRKRLTILFGTSDWEERFYRMETVQDLFGEWEELQRDATVKNIQGYINERLATCFTAVADSLVLRDSKASPLFALCFAAANERGRTHGSEDREKHIERLNRRL